MAAENNPVYDLIHSEIKRINCEIDISFEAFLKNHDLVEESKHQPNSKLNRKLIGQLKNKKSDAGKRYFFAIRKLMALEEFLDSYSDKQHVDYHKEDQEIVTYTTDKNGNIRGITYLEYKQEYFDSLNKEINNIKSMDEKEKGDTIRSITQTYFSNKEKAAQERAEALKRAKQAEEQKEIEEKEQGKHK